MPAVGIFFRVFDLGGGAVDYDGVGRVGRHIAAGDHLDEQEVFLPEDREWEPEVLAKRELGGKQAPAYGEVSAEADTPEGGHFEPEFCVPINAPWLRTKVFTMLSLHRRACRQLADDSS